MGARAFDDNPPLALFVIFLVLALFCLVVAYLAIRYGANRDADGRLKLRTVLGLAMSFVGCCTISVASLVQVLLDRGVFPPSNAEQVRRWAPAIYMALVGVMLALLGSTLGVIVQDRRALRRAVGTEPERGAPTQRRNE
jgi:hypothetical protein